MNTLESIQCLLYTGSDKQAAWIFQGLRHITGIRPWSAYNKAKLMNQLMQKEQKSLGEVGKKFGLTPHGAGQWIRGYNAFRQAKDDTEYSREINESAYTYFQELFGHSNKPLRDWMEWNEKEYRFDDVSAFNELLTWLYPKPSEAELDDDQDPADVLGDWNNRRLVTNRGLRDISYLKRHAIEQFEEFRNGRNLAEAVASARLADAQHDAERRRQPASDLLSRMDDIAGDLMHAPTIIYRHDNELRDQLFSKLSKLEDAIGKVKNEYKVE